MITTIRFEAHDDEVFSAEIASEADIYELVETIWRDKVEQVPYQLADADLVLRYARTLPGWMLEELPREAVAWIVLARHEKETWVILWVIPIFAGDELGTRYIYEDELRIDPVDMRMIQ